MGSGADRSLHQHAGSGLDAHSIPPPRTSLSPAANMLRVSRHAAAARADRRNSTPQRASNARSSSLLYPRSSGLAIANCIPHADLRDSPQRPPSPRDCRQCIRKSSRPPVAGSHVRLRRCERKNNRANLPPRSRFQLRVLAAAGPIDESRGTPSLRPLGKRNQRSPRLSPAHRLRGNVPRSSRDDSRSMDSSPATSELAPETRRLSATVELELKSLRCASPRKHITYSNPRKTPRVRFALF